MHNKSWKTNYLTIKETGIHNMGNLNYITLVVKVVQIGKWPMKSLNEKKKREGEKKEVWFFLVLKGENMLLSSSSGAKI